MIADAHSHWLPEEIIANAHFFSRAWGDIESQVKMMETVGVSRALLSYPTTDAHLKLGGLGRVAGVYNDNVGAILRKYPDKFYGAAVLPVGDAANMLVELKRATEELGFGAISLATSYNGVYLDDPMFIPVYREAARSNTPIFVHSQIVDPIGTERVRDPLLTPVVEYVFDTTISVGKLLMSGVLQDYPDVKFVFAYFGGVTSFLGRRYDATYRMLRSINFVKDLKGDPTEFLKRIYVDTSGDTTAANLESALELFGPGHVLWGSDWPAKKDIAGSIQAVTDLGIASEAKEKILGGNLVQLVGGS